jgi:hypothetical protein
MDIMIHYHPYETLWDEVTSNVVLSTIECNTKKYKLPRTVIASILPILQTKQRVLYFSLYLIYNIICDSLAHSLGPLKLVNDLEHSHQIDGHQASQVLTNMSFSSFLLQVCDLCLRYHFCLINRLAIIPYSGAICHHSSLSRDIVFIIIKSAPVLLLFGRLLLFGGYGN